MALFVRHILSEEESRAVLKHFQNDVFDLLDMYGYCEEFVDEVKVMIARHSNVEGFKPWAVSYLRYLREQKEAKEKESEDKSQELLYMKAQNDLLQQQIHDVFNVHGTVDEDDPLLNWLTQPWVYRLEKSLNMCHTHPDTARVFRELLTNRCLTRPEILNEEFLNACIPHLNYNHPVTANSLKEGIRKNLNMS